MREILIKDKESGLENAEGRALNKSGSLGDVARLFSLDESLVGAKRRALLPSLKRPCEDREDDGVGVKQKIQI